MKSHDWTSLLRNWLEYSNKSGEMASKAFGWNVASMRPKINPLFHCSRSFFTQENIFISWFIFVNTCTREKNLESNVFLVYCIHTYREWSWLWLFSRVLTHHWFTVWLSAGRRAIWKGPAIISGCLTASSPDSSRKRSGSYKLWLMSEAVAHCWPGVSFQACRLFSCPCGRSSGQRWRMRGERAGRAPSQRYLTPKQSGNTRICLLR